MIAASVISLESKAAKTSRRECRPTGDSFVGHSHDPAAHREVDTNNCPPHAAKESTRGFDSKLLQTIDDIIRGKARQLARQPGFQPSQQEDLQQELLVTMQERWSSFDQKRASARTFAARITNTKAASLVRAHHAAKRGTGQCVPSNNDSVHVASDFDEQEVRSKRGILSRSAIEASALRMDIAGVMADLPIDLQRLCQHLSHGSITEVARSLGWHRTTVYRSIGELRNRFVAAGLHGYL